MHFQCQCGRIFSRKDNLHRHIITACILNKTLCDMNLKRDSPNKTRKPIESLLSNNCDEKSRRCCMNISYNKNNGVKCTPKTRKDDDSSETMSSDSEDLVSASDLSEDLVTVSDSSEDICYLKR